MKLELVGSMASEPTDSEGWLSVIGVQCICGKSPSVVFQTPPAAAPRKTTAGFLGSTASAVTRPELLGPPLKGKKPLVPTLMGCGPIKVHAAGPGKSVANGAAFSAGSKPIFRCTSIIWSTGFNALWRRPVATEPSGSVRSPTNHSSRSFREPSSSRTAPSASARFEPPAGDGRTGGRVVVLAPGFFGFAGEAEPAVSG